MAGKSRRTTHRSVSGTKLYAVRDAQGRFKDMQTYKLWLPTFRAVIRGGTP
jgi:hypothetical protein